MITTAIAITYLYFSLREMFTSLVEEFKRATGSIWSKLLAAAKTIPQTAISCPKCFAFWVGLIVTLNPIAAALASMAFDLYDRIKLKLQ